MADASSRGPAVALKEDLYRAILYPSWWDQDERQVSSAAFGFPKFSADIVSMTNSRDSLSHFAPGSGLVQFNCGLARSLGFDACHEPEEGNDAHAHVYSDLGSSQRKKKAKKLAESSAVVVEPDLTLLQPTK